MKKRWNWIDTTIVILIVVALLAFVNRDKILNIGKEEEVSNEKSVTITLEAEMIDKNIVSNLKVGDQLFSQYSLQKGFVEEINISPAIKTQVGDDGKLYTYEDENQVNVEIKLKADVATSGPYMIIGGQEVKVGINIIMKTTEVEFISKIKEIEVN